MYIVLLSQYAQFCILSDRGVATYVTTMVTTRILRKILTFIVLFEIVLLHLYYLAFSLTLIVFQNFKIKYTQY